ncbi:MAG: TRAP transporter substrate-binding protein [Candidatus Tectomicrobia bacterium]|uniref:TRAP transporter substrate-binding protein n=1 Tax=Tectimicrobiota bacterium TaxID=2528274 RepID=A0A932LZJ9_UNCTE|nr:TRAP transporter substrate-binding protein [Candidatus Tectomicrobia bacterium]
MRKAIGLLLVIVLAGLLTYDAGSPVGAQEIDLKLSHFMAPAHPMDQFVMRPWAQKVEKLTRGKVKIKLFPGGVLGPPPAQYNSAVKNIANIAFGLQGYTPGRFSVTSVMELPFLVDDSTDGTRVMWDLMKTFLKDEYKDTHVLLLWQSDPAIIMTRKKPVKTLEDMQGLKIRSPSAAQAGIISALGGVPVQMPITDAYNSLERGVIDGIMAPWSAVRSFKFDEIANYYTDAGIARSTFFLVLNQKVWDDLPADAKQVISETTGVEESVHAAQVYMDIAEKAKSFVKQKRSEIILLLGAEKTRWKKAVRPFSDQWVRDMEKKGLAGEKILAEAEKLAEKYEKSR